jgi:hypothetical protein
MNMSAGLPRQIELLLFYPYVQETTHVILPSVYEYQQD